MIEADPLARLRAMGPAELADLMRSKLVLAHTNSVDGVPAAISFEDDPYAAWEPPADAMARLAHRLGDAFLPTFKLALLDIVSLSRPERVRPTVVEDALLAVGLLQADLTLPEAARTVLSSSGLWGNAGSRLQGVLLTVLKGMSGSTGATQAAQLFVGHPLGRPTLTFDALEVLVASPVLPLHEALSSADGKLSMLVRPATRRKFDRRLRDFVAQHLMHRPLPDLARAIQLLCADAMHLDAGHPMGLVIKRLLCDRDSPLQRRGTAIGDRMVNSADNSSVPWPVLSPAAEAFLREHAPVQPTNPGVLRHQEEWTSELEDAL